MENDKIVVGISIGDGQPKRFCVRTVTLAKILKQAMEDAAEEMYGGVPMGVSFLIAQRLAAGMTQTGLALAAKVGRCNLNAIESGRRIMGKKVAKKLAAVLNCDWNQLLGKQESI